VKSRSGRRVLLAAALMALAGGQAAAESPRGPINVDVLVSHVSQRPPSPPPEVPGLTGNFIETPPRVREIDERVRRLDKMLRGTIRYDTIRFVKRHRMVLERDEVGTVKLPNGRLFRAHLRDVNEQGALMDVVVEELLQLEVQAPSGHLVVIGSEPYQDGQLVISVEPNY
jgi:hypothetical protein